MVSTEKQWADMGSNSSDSSSRSDSESEFEVEDKDMKLYPHHIPTNQFQKMCLSIGSSVAALVDPYRDDMVAVLGETTGHTALERIYRKMMESDEGRAILEDKPIINSHSVDYERLENLPQNTMGYKYAQFMKSQGISSDTRKPVKFVDDVQLAYIMQRYRETHDLVHSLLDMKTNMLGEVTIKWVEALQTDLPMCWSGAIFGAIRLAPKQRHNYVNHYLPWALRCGHKSKLLINVYFERRWEQDVDDLRAELKIPKLPHIS
jgi:ubiquinone biosynthesis protein Coq4